MYKNDRELVTCSNCHDPHRATPNPRQLRVNPLDNAALCGGCHGEAADLSAHLAAKLIPTTEAKLAAAKCTDCHMVKVAKTGAGAPAAMLGTVQYWANDISSHLFAVPPTSLAAQMPVPYTSECGTCHSAL